MATCKICNYEYMSEVHKNTDIHRFNYLLYEWKNSRKKLVKDRNGIMVSLHLKKKTNTLKDIDFNRNKGIYIVNLSSKEFLSINNRINFDIEVLNERKNEALHIMKATILVPYKAFHFSDQENTCKTGNIIELDSKQTYKYSLQFKMNTPLIGSYKIPLAFTFQTSNKPESFTIAREIVVIIQDFHADPIDKEKSPFKYCVWDDIVVIIPPVVTLRYSNKYPIPKKYYRFFMAGLNEQYINVNQTILLNYVKSCICEDYSQTGNFESQYPTENNYCNFYHFLLWIDEVGQKLMLERYNMTNVTMKVIQGDMLELEVPGLAEKRPSLVAGDIVKMRFHEDHTVYQGSVKTINDKTIWIYNMHIDLLNAIKNNKNIELDVAFELGRLSYERMHEAVDVCVNKNLLTVLFPNDKLEERNFQYRLHTTDKRFFNKSILQNNEQKTAVLNILNRTSQNVPYIVFGPPGTGKTITIVEAILQIKQYIPNSKILVCAPANAACDMLTEKLAAFIHNKEDLIRIHTESRNWNEVPVTVRPFSNHDGNKYVRITANQLSSHRIVITTLCLIGKYSGKYTPDHVFIDEAAQAMEPEADIAISMLEVGKQLILAGDPKQLGPLCSSTVAAKHKLENSLLERLMETNSLYQRGNNRFITMLKQNYRAHPLVLEVPNKLFYEDQLQAVNKEAANDPISKHFIYPLTLLKPYKSVSGLPVEFCAVNAKERREGKSPSYFNESEVEMVVKYINAILSLPNIKVAESEIGVIAPYIRQVHRIKTCLKNHGRNNVEVGTTEVFQGREKRIIIISTVRAQHNLLLFDKQYKLGFVKNEKRMNVALTRAKSKLIIIGNPHVLGTCENWEYYIKFCEERQAYFAAEYLRRTNEVKHDITRRFTGIKFGDPVPKDTTKQTRRRKAK